MHDIKFIRENPELLDAALKKRYLEPLSEKILSLDTERRKKIFAFETVKAGQNELSKEIGTKKNSLNHKAFEKLRESLATKKLELNILENESKDLDSKLNEVLLTIPNSPDDNVQVGKTENENLEIRSWGEPKVFDFQPKEHFDLSGASGLDFTSASVMSGSRFVVLSDAMATLHRALGQFMLNTHIREHGFTEKLTPVLVRSEAMIGTGQLPKFAEDSYETKNGWWLIPTAEVTLTNLFAKKMMPIDQLPSRICAISQCFRSEAGSAGRDTKGMLRQHQFEKVEMVCCVEPSESENELLRMTSCAQNILESLELPYRTMQLCSGDLGFSAKKTYDIEVWLPGQNSYREISSCSNCGDFQARRLQAKYKPHSKGKPTLVHTLNGSGVAVGRCLIAILENYQNSDGSISIPTKIQPLLGGAKKINSEGGWE